MKYTVEVHKENGQIESGGAMSMTSAIKLAETKAIEDVGNVFVTWNRTSDGQHGYLNSNGDHAITGLAW